MTSCDRHGGKRRGAGRKPKWDPLFKLRVGQDCERLFREASKEALNQNKGKILNEETELDYLWKQVALIPVNLRSKWLREEFSDFHVQDIEAELKLLNSNNNTAQSNNRIIRISKKPPRGTRKMILSKIASKYSLSTKQVDNLWQAYRRLENSLSE